jgi:putative endonuclease
MNAYVYILRCADDSYYVGSTRTALERRLAEHNAGIFGGYTARRRPVRLIYHQEFLRIEDAIGAERQIKGWSRAKKEALIRGDFEALRIFPKRGTRFGPPKSANRNAQDR